MSAPAPERPAEESPEQVLRSAMEAMNGDGPRLSLAEALFLVEHPEVRVSTDADYPGWTPGGAR